MRQKFEAIRVTQETHEQAKFLAEKSGKSISKTVSEIVDAVFNIACTFSALNLCYDYCITESRVTITCEGSNNLTCGVGKSPTAEKESRFSPITVEVKPKVKKGD
jgi:hypothetical protein